MLLYHNKGKLRLFVQRYGSLFFRKDSLFIGFLMGILTVGFQALFENYPEYCPVVDHPYGAQALGSLVTFTVVFRTNLGWARYWEAITQPHFMYSKWTDAYSQFCAFVSVTIKDNKDKEDSSKEDFLRCIQAIVENDYLLLSIIVCDRLSRSDSARMDHRSRQGTSWNEQITMRSQLHREVTRDMNGGSTMPQFNELQQGQDLHEAVYNCAEGHHWRSRNEESLMAAWEGASYPITRKPTEKKYEKLSTSTDRPQMVMFWILHSMSDASDKLKIAPPIQSRMYQELSNGMLGFRNVLKIADVPFPFPHAQIIMILLVFWMCLIPIFMMNFTKSWITGPVLASLLVMATWCLNELAIELEDPFGLDANDLSLQDFHIRFMQGIKEITGASESIEQLYIDELVQARDRLRAETIVRTPHTGLQAVSLNCIAIQEAGRISASAAATGPTALQSDGRLPVPTIFGVNSPETTQDKAALRSSAICAPILEQKQAKAQAPVIAALDVHLERIGLRMEEHLATIANQLSLLADLSRDGGGLGQRFLTSNIEGSNSPSWSRTEPGHIEVHPMSRSSGDGRSGELHPTFGCW
eukprot:TRINITY_DN102892_c0_g1_i1.p1 TRINITY_DN102892_c0_g1~~TRINITY_DN102892_c0_g1_i1.p1  ORF type:complete len:583 (+),score=83.06 TRINITY_DN102892_c0_g1_i1:58-1806(+)